MLYSIIEDCCYATQDWNVKGRTNVISGLVRDLLIGCGIINDNVDSNVFNAWLEKIFIPDLPQNSIIVMGNTSFHKSNKTTKILSKYRHKIEFLPPYYPDLNPMEFKWAQAKSIRRKLRCDVFELFASHIMQHYILLLLYRQSIIWRLLYKFQNKFNIIWLFKLCLFFLLELELLLLFLGRSIGVSVALIRMYIVIH